MVRQRLEKRLYLLCASGFAAQEEGGKTSAKFTLIKVLLLTEKSMQSSLLFSITVKLGQLDIILLWFITVVSGGPLTTATGRK